MFMDSQTVDGTLFAKMLSGGLYLLSAHERELNSLNVFPVSDGDTGSNMIKTVRGGTAEIERNISYGKICTVSSLFAKGALLGARGNSGVILSQIFAGISKGLAGIDKANASDLAKAYSKGIETSYAAVTHPVEGTILTVFRESVEYAIDKIDSHSSIEDFYSLHIKKAEQSLAETPNLLKVLKDSDVVDSGAAGYLYFAKGMQDILEGREHAVSDGELHEEAVDIEKFTRNSVLEFGYCTEFLLRLTTSKVDPDSFDINCIINDLENLNGESIVAYKQDDIIKVHVHTFFPGRILAKMQDYGEFLTVKVENMMLSHDEKAFPSKKTEKPYSVVATASGNGMIKLFENLGADVVIKDESPSAGEFIDAFKKCSSKQIIVLPNHKNSFLVARQAASMINDTDIRVIETKSFMQGYSALSVLTPGLTDIDSLQKSAALAAENVVDGDVAMAVKDAEINGFSIKKGEYIARAGGVIAAVEKTAENSLKKLLESSVTPLTELITVFAGKDISDIENLKSEISDLYPDCEVTVIEGGQDIYDYLIALE